MKHVSLPTLLEAHHKSETENAHTAMVGRVVSYDSSTMCAAVQPLTKRPGQNEAGDTQYEEIPTFPQVPVAFPRSGSFILYMPIVKGTYGTLVFFDMSPAEALSTGQVSEPQDVSRHSGGYCFFIPGVYPINQAVSDQPDHPYFGVDGDEAQVHTSSGEIKLGKTASEYVALASLVSAQLTTLKNAISAAPTVPNDGGAAFKAALVAALATWPGNMAATVAKAK